MTLSKFANNKIKLDLHRAMYLSALDRHEENIAFCENLCSNIKKNSKEYFNFKLIILASYRSLNMIDECIIIHKEFINNKVLRNTREWGIFLRICEMYLDRNKSLHFLRKSVTYFENDNDKVQAGKSLISYSYILASQGKIKMALKKVILAEQYLKGKHMGYHMFLVNHAAIRLLNGESTEEVWELLNRAELSAVVSFDKLAIIINKIVWCIENKNTDRYQLLLNKANTLLEIEPDKHIHGLIYYDFYYLLKNINENDANKYLVKARELKSFCKPVKARLDNKVTPETRFALTKLWHVCFLAYWTYDLE